MEYKIFVNNPFQENTVILYDASGEAAIVDCGCFNQEEEKKMEHFFTSTGIKPVILLNTHLHPDHIFGNRFVEDRYDLRTQASQDDDFLIEHAVEYSAMLGLSGITPPPAVGTYLKDGDVVKFGNSQLQVIAVGGHSPGGLCFYSEADHLLISGDVLFAGSVGRADLPGGNARLLIEGIRERLLVLPDDVQVIPGHGPMTTIGEERKYNPFLNDRGY